MHSNNLAVDAGPTVTGSRLRLIDAVQSPTIGS